MEPSSVDRNRLGKKRANDYLTETSQNLGLLLIYRCDKISCLPIRRGRFRKVKNLSARTFAGAEYMQG